MAFDPNNLQYAYESRVGGSSAPSTSTYSINFNYDGKSYTFVPEKVINKGVVSDGNTALFKNFLDKKNQKSFFSEAIPVDLDGVSWFGDYVKDNVKTSTNGYLVPSAVADKILVNPNVLKTSEVGDVKGIGTNHKGETSYISSPKGYDYGYINSKSTKAQRVTAGKQENSLLGDIFGDVGESVAGTIRGASDILHSLGPIGTVGLNYAVPGLGTALTVGNEAGRGNLEGAATAAIIGEATGNSLSGDVGVAGTPIWAGATDPNAANAPTIDTIAADYYGVPVGSEYVAPTVTDLGTVAGSTKGIASGTSAADLAAAGSSGGGIAATPGAGLQLASTTGAPTLTAGGTSLAEMGGAQGLTTAGAAGGTLGAAGLNAATGATAAGVGSGLGLTDAATGAGAATNYGAAGAGAAAAGTTLADVLPYTTAANVVGSVISADAAKDAASVQVDAANKATALQQKNFETINQQQAPYRATGYNALNNIAGLTTGATPQYDASGNIVRDANGNPVMISGSGYLQHQFNANDLKAGLAPNYDFMLQQGQMANQRAANMGGGALGGNALQGLNKYTQDYAGNAYQNAFTNYQNQRNNIYNTLAGIAGIGQTGQNATNTASTNYTNAASQLGVGSAAAQAAGTTGAANAYGNAVNNVTNSYTLASLLNQGGRIA